MNYKDFVYGDESNDETLNKKNLISPVEILEELYDFESADFIRLIQAFALFFISGNSEKCQLILIKEIIPFFQSRNQVFGQDMTLTIFFIAVFKENNIFDYFSLIILDKNKILLKPTILLLSLLSSLNEAFVRCISESRDLLNSVYSRILEFNDLHLFENCVILLNNTLRFSDIKIENSFIQVLFDKSQSIKLETSITLNLIINLVRFSELTISNMQFISEMIFEGLQEKLYFESMYLIYYAYQSPDNKLVLFQNLPFIIRIINELESASIFFSNRQLILLYFRILLDILIFDEDDKNGFKTLIYQNFQFEAIKNIQKKNDSQILQYILLFLSKSPAEFILKYSNELFQSEVFFLYFIIDCINDSDWNLKRSGIMFLPVFLKATNPKFLTFLTDARFVDSLINFIESDEPENQKLALRFLNVIIESNLYFQSYSKQLFEKFNDDELKEEINDLVISSEDDEISVLADHVIGFISHISE